MSYKMKGFSGFKSPLKKKYNFSGTRDLSPEGTKGTIGAKIAKAVQPDNMLEVIPVGKALKMAKALYKYTTT